MALKKEDMRPGLVVVMTDNVCMTSDVFEVTIVGQDPTGKWVGYCEDWAFKVSQIDDEDYEYMEMKQ